METLEADKNLQKHAEKRSPFLKWIGRLFRFFLFAAIILGSTALSYRWLANPPATQRRPPKPESVLVEVHTVELRDQRILVEAMGKVVPAREIQMAARVSGQVVEVAPQFVPGGHFRAGELVLSIERTDFELAVRQQEASLVKAQADVTLEMGQQAVAKREYELLEEIADVEDEELLLRQPQLRAKHAAVSMAEAARDKARLDLERTKVKAPFNALIQARSADLGSYVTPNTPLAALVGTDEFWVEVSVPVDDLFWIGFSGAMDAGDIPVRVYDAPAWGSGVHRLGKVSRLLADVEAEGRMARLLVCVSDPLCLEGGDETPHLLLLGSFVRVEIEGKEIRDVAKIPRTALRDGGRVWVMMQDDTLDIRDVQVAWSGQEEVFVSQGLEAGDMLVLSDLATPVHGMMLRTGSGGGSNPERAE